MLLPNSSLLLGPVGDRRPLALNEPPTKKQKRELDDDEDNDDEEDDEDDDEDDEEEDGYQNDDKLMLTKTKKVINREIKCVNMKILEDKVRDISSKYDITIEKSAMEYLVAALNKRIKQVCLDLVGLSQEKCEERKHKQKIKLSCAPKKNIIQLVKRDVEDREKTGELEPRRPERPSGNPFTNRDYEELKYLWDLSRKGELSQQLSSRLREKVREYTVWSSYTSQEREFRRLKEYQNSILNGTALATTSTNTTSTSTSTTTTTSTSTSTTTMTSTTTDKSIAGKDFAFYVQRNVYLKSKPPFHSALLGVTNLFQSDEKKKDE